MKSFSIKEAFTYGWAATKKHFTLFLGLLIVILAIGFGIEMLASGVEDTDYGAQAGLGLINFIFDTLVGLSLVYIGLRIFDGKETSFQDVFAPYHMFLKYLGGSILFGIMVFVGFILLIIPGIYVAVTYGLFQYILIEKNVGPIVALKESARITKGHKWNLLGFGILVGVINIIGALLFVVGLIVTIPISIMASVYVYKAIMTSAQNAGQDEGEPETAEKTEENQPEIEEKQSQTA